VRTLTVGIGVAPGDIKLDLGEFHPVSQGGFQLELTLNGEVITGAQPRIGFMHRGAEKLFEARDYRQIMMLANRHDWLAPFTSELGVALTLESAMGITPPARATWIRMLLAEITRANAQLAFLVGSVDPEISRAIRQFRESVAEWMAGATGNRVHPMYARIGGVAHDLPHESIVAANELSKSARDLALRSATSIRKQGFAGVAVLSTKDAINFGASGPVGHASGLNNDSRFSTPNLFYSELPISSALTGESAVGDAESRFLQLVAQIELSATIIEEVIPRLDETDGADINVVLPKMVRAPEGTNYSWSEGPTGINGWLLVSAGDKTPWRLKLRPASFNNLQAIAHALTDTPLVELAIAIKSSFIVIGDVDR
jgi:NADH-quinone oxidoreductase subunit D